MRPSLPPIQTYLERVIDETAKAGGYLAAARAFRFVPRLEERWAQDPPTQLGVALLRQGTHMAFTVTLAALLEQSNTESRVNLPSLLDRFNDARVRAEIAKDRESDPAVVYSRMCQLQRRFQARLVPVLPALKAIRNNVVAHHGAHTDWPDVTIGLLNKMLYRTVALVDGISAMMTGYPTTIRLTMSTARYQTATLLDAGIDGDGDLDIGPPRDV